MDLLLRKLPEESQIVLIKMADVVEAGADHGDAFEAEAEGVAGPLRGIEADGFKDLGVDYAATAEFEPLAGEFPQVGRHEIHFEARLGEREEGRAQADLRARAEQPAHQIIQRGLQVDDGDAAVDAEAFELVEIRAVGGVDIVAAEDAAGGEDAEGRLFLEERADLHGRGVRAQQVALGAAAGDIASGDCVGQIKSVLLVARGVVGRGVEGVEVEPFGFQLGAFGNGEADFAKEGADLAAGVGERVEEAGRGVGCGEGGVEGRAEAGGEGGGVKAGEGFGEKFFEFLFVLVDEAAGGGFFGGRQGAHDFHGAGEGAFGADVAGLERLEVRARGEGRGGGAGFGQQGGEGGFHGAARNAELWIMPAEIKQQSHGEGIFLRPSQKQIPGRSQTAPPQKAPFPEKGRPAVAGPRPFGLRFRRGAEGGLGLVENLGEGGAVVDGEFAQGFAVETDLGGLQAGHKSAIGQPATSGADGGVDADDPEAAEVALLALAVLVGVLARARESVLGIAIQLRLVAEVALGFPQRALAARFGVNGVGDTRHGKGELRIKKGEFRSNGQETEGGSSLFPFAIMGLERVGHGHADEAGDPGGNGFVLAGLAFLLLGLGAEQVAAAGRAAEDFAAAGDLETLGDGLFGFTHDEEGNRKGGNRLTNHVWAGV